MKLHYVSGSRADFGLMKLCLQHIHLSGRHDLAIVVTGQHLLDSYGRSVNDIRAAELTIAAEIPVALGGKHGAEMARALATEIAGCLELWQRDRPDLVLVLGDRGEMLAATLAAVHLGIHVAHIHGGERSGTLDESLRHAISKLVHLHFPATDDAANRLIRMGERADIITVIGAPGLVGLPRSAKDAPDQSALRARFGLSQRGPLSLVVFHPVVQEAHQAADQMRVLIDALRGLGHMLLILRPNSDAGGQGIDCYLDGMEGHEGLAILTHLVREDYLSVLAEADLMVGNSSSGIIESASFDTPCVNLGKRQNDRLRNANTVDCLEITRVTIEAAVTRALTLQGPFKNLYGDGRTDQRLLMLLDTLYLNPALLEKSNAY